MKKNKPKYRNCMEERRVELLKQHYDYDEQTKTFDIVLHYAKASDLFNESLDLIKKKMMKEEVVEQIADLLTDIPNGYKAELSLVIDDYENIPYQEILDAFHNVINVRFSRYKGANIRRYHKVGILVVIGAFLIALMIAGETLSWWGGETVDGRLISYMLDVAGCVLIWEGLYSALLEKTQDAVLGYALSRRLSSVGLYFNDGSDEAVLSEKNGEVLIIQREPLAKKTGAMFLYLSGFFLIGAGVVGIMLHAPSMVELVRLNGGLAIAFSLAELIFSAFLCGLGLLAIKMFNEDYRFFILTAIITVILGVFAVLSVVSLFFGKNKPVSIVTAIVSLVAMIFYVVGFALSTHYHKADIKRTLSQNK